MRASPLQQWCILATAAEHSNKAMKSDRFSGPTADDPGLPPFTIRTVSWQQAEQALRPLREQVFIREQQVPEALEWDGEDSAALHLLAEDARGRPIGTARLLVDGHIGRVAVLAPWRGRGVGRALMQRMLQEAWARGHREVFLDAQLTALDFYAPTRLSRRGRGVHGRRYPPPPHAPPPRPLPALTARVHLMATGGAR